MGGNPPFKETPICSMIPGSKKPAKLVRKEQHCGLRALRLLGLAQWLKMILETPPKLVPPRNVDRNLWVPEKKCHSKAHHPFNIHPITSHPSHRNVKKPTRDIPKIDRDFYFMTSTTLPFFFRLYSKQPGEIFPRFFHVIPNKKRAR